ncbi:uncharacterized protein LOC142163917 [Nicotiana tabacum]|uniref:Uncharacterized protein LOC142163917 n=1 Tax=Nicotiana tabacum TaxID=4097 RepID=A0AC58RWR6_TOBAC
MATTLTKTLPDLSKFEPLKDGNNYKCWSQKLLIFFEQLEVDYVLFNEPPADIIVDSPNVATTVVDDDNAKKKFEKDNKTVRGHLLNHMTNPLFDLFINYKSAKVIWDILEKKYGGDDAEKRSIWLESGSSFRWLMISRSWRRNKLKYKKKNLTLQKLISRMRTEEANRLKDKESERLKDKIKSLPLLILLKLTLWNLLCNQRQGQSSKQGGKAIVQANLTEGASRHLCANKELFHDFEESADGECVYMGDSTTAKVMGKGKILLKLTSEKTLALNNVLYVPSLRRNLVSGALLNKADLADFKNTINKGGKKYYITFVDDFSRYTKCYANEHENELRRSKRRRIEASFGPDFITTFLTENIDLDVWSDELVSIYLIEEDPKTYNEAMSKWIFKKKLRPDGIIEKCKARLIIRDFNQKKGIDYFDTYSPVTKIATIRTLVALAAINNLVIHQMDVKIAFLNGDLEEEICMSQPEGFASKQWYEKFNSTLVDNGFVVNASDTCVYFKMIGSDCVIICLYVDNMLIFGPNVNVVNETKNFLSSKFEMKDLEEVDVILGIKIKRTSNGFSLYQSHYIEKMLKRFNCFDVAPMRTPYDPSITLEKE